MSRIAFSILVLFGMTVPSTSFGRLEHSKFRVKGDRLVSRAVLYPAAEDPSFSLVRQDRKISVDAKPAPVNLWLLIDNSKSCLKTGFEKKVSGIIKRVRKGLPSDSLVSVVTYTRDSLEIHAKYRSPSQLSSDTIKCEERGLAGSFGHALVHMTRNKVQSSLPTEVWVYSSGATGLTDKQIAQVKKLPIRVVVYNKGLVKTMQASARRLQQRGLRISAQAVSEGLPSRRYHLSTKIPTDLTGRSIQLKLVAQVGDKPVSAKSFTVHTPKREPQLMDHLPTALWVLGILAFLYMTFRMVRYYRGVKCKKCQRRLRLDDVVCAFCEGDQVAYLVGKTNIVDPKRFQKEDVTAIRSTQYTIGSRRGSHLRLLVPKLARGRRFVRIQQDVRTPERSYRILPVWNHERFPVELNGHTLKGPKYLSHGDKLKFGETEVTFLVGGDRELA